MIKDKSNTLEPSLLLDIVKKTLSRGGEYADVFVEHTTPTTIQMEDSRIEKLVSGSDSGAGIRLISGGKTSFAYSNDLSPASLLEMASTLSKAASGGSAGVDIDMTTPAPGTDFIIKMPPSGVPVSDKVHLIESADRAARGYDSRIIQVSITYRDSVQFVQIANSDGTVAEDERIHTLAVVNVIVEDGGTIQTGYEPIGGHVGFELFEECPFDELARKAACRAVKMLGARRAPGGRMPVVISSEAGGTMIHEAIGHGLEADLAGQHLSIYSDKLGQRVASPLVTVIDSSIVPNKRGSFRYDDEGTPSQETVLVKEGMLVGYMFDRLNSMRFGGRLTGNGRRQSYRYRPIPRMTNTYIERGATPPEDILGSTSSGLFVRKMGGGQVNTVNGDFVFDVQEGYLIEGGKLGELVRGATLTGSGPAVLMAVDMVGTDLGFSIGTCGKDAQGVPVSDAMPTIRVPEMVVGGQV